jgi:hypothetical protein
MKELFKETWVGGIMAVITILGVVALVVAYLTSEITTKGLGPFLMQCGLGIFIALAVLSIASNLDL